MNDLKHARQMLAMANKDFSALQGMSDAAIFPEEIFGFHAQQAIEKALKSWLAARSISYPFKHDLGCCSNSFPRAVRMFLYFATWSGTPISRSIFAIPNWTAMRFRATERVFAAK